VVPSVQHCKVWLTPTTKLPCSNAAKTQNPLKFAGVPQTCHQVSAISRPKFTILAGHMEAVLLFYLHAYIFYISVQLTAV